MIKHSYSFLFIAMAVSCTKTQDIIDPAPFMNRVPLHAKFNITLPEDHSTGYLWQMGNAYNKKTVDYMNSVWHGNEKGVTFNFETREKGSAELEFRLIKYQDTLETKKFWIEVK